MDAVRTRDELIDALVIARKALDRCGYVECAYAGDDRDDCQNEKARALAFIDVVLCGEDIERSFPVSDRIKVRAFG
jgi:hypothetical protein